MADPYELAPTPLGPELPGEVVLRDSCDEAFDAAATDMLMHAAACVRRFGSFHVAFAAGRAVEQFQMRLLTDPKYRGIPWAQTHLWLADEVVGERAGAGGHGRHLEETVAQFAGVPSAQVHVIEAGQPGAGERYQRELREHLGWRERGHDRLDLVVLELDAAGAVGGLSGGFVGAPDEIVHVDAGSGRAALTPGMLNASRMVAVMAVGASVRGAVARLADGASSGELPASWLRPKAGELRWYLDREANPMAPIERSDEPAPGGGRGGHARMP